MGRILDIGDGAAGLRVRDSQLVIGLAEGGEVTTPLAELAAVVISGAHVVMTQAVIAGVADSGGAVVICDARHLPAAMMLPIQAHVTQTERFACQARMPLPLRKRLWRQIVAAKIRAQGRLLADLHQDDGGLVALSQRVAPGDSGNLEGRAAQRYWPLLFADPGFRRGREGPDQNANLNYGYAVLRALTARALCGAGLHPSLGLQHHNRYDPFCLANDLMEPFRPLVDRAVYAWVQDHDPSATLEKQAKAFLVAPMLAAYTWQGETRSLFDWVARSASSLVAAITAKGRELELAEV
ncbi:MAG TPA: type II CRISPR-associated endonuclease Cas1 [Terriglobales bacterium]|nr:type II CRISPR-associated endonuclease Cas1 [Terriglobales bacterium]